MVSHLTDKKQPNPKYAVWKAEKNKPSRQIVTFMTKNSFPL